MHQILTDFKMSILGQSAVKHSSNKSLGTMVTGSSLAHENPSHSRLSNPSDRQPRGWLALAKPASLLSTQVFQNYPNWPTNPLLKPLSSESSVSVCMCVCDMIDSLSSVQSKPPFKRCHFQVRFLICNWCFCYLCSWCEAIETTLD